MAVQITTPIVHATPMSESSFRVVSGVEPIAFDDYAALEEGAAREFIDSELLTPLRKSPSDGRLFFHDAFRLCKLVRPQKSIFQLYDEGSRTHLMSARKENDRYFISLYELDASETSARCCAVLLRRGGGKMRLSYRLFLCVGTCPLDFEARPIIEVWPSATFCTGQYVRTLNINMLPPSNDVNPHYTHDYSKLTFNTQSPTSIISHDSIIRLRNKTPVLKNGAYSLKFARDRAKLSSSKNFLIFRDDILHNNQASVAEHAVFQLGKMGSKTFALDFCNPISPLQAFAIALSAFDSKSTEQGHFRR